MRKNYTDSERNYIKNSNCGMLDAARMVCCPLPGMLKARFSAPASLPALGTCGQTSDNRIVGGSIAQLDEYPWLARIQYYKCEYSVRSERQDYQPTTISSRSALRVD